MGPGIGEKGSAEGVYQVSCLGPASAKDGERIGRYVVAHPEFAEAHGDQCNVEAAKLLGIELVEKWQDAIHNTVQTEGKNLLLDTGLAGSAYTVTGPFMGLISSVSYTAISAGDTAAQIDGTNQWKEAGSSTNYPLYQVSSSAVRATCVFSSASAGAKSLSTALSFAIVTTGGTVEGAFVIYGPGATSAIGNTSGKLLSAGVFGTGARAVLIGDTLNVSWSLAI